jgi:hypothetical protein
MPHDNSIRLSLNTFAVSLLHNATPYIDNAENIASCIAIDDMISSVLYKRNGVVYEKTADGIAESLVQLAMSQISIKAGDLVMRLYCNHGKLKVYKCRTDDCQDAIPYIRHIADAITAKTAKAITLGPIMKYMVNYCTHAGRHIDLDKLHINCGATVVIYDVSDTNLKARVIFRHNNKQITCILFREGKINILRTSDIATASIAREKIIEIITPYLYTPPQVLEHTGEYETITMMGTPRRIPIMRCVLGEDSAAVLSQSRTAD